MGKLKVGDIVLVEAQLAGADEDIQEDVFGGVGIVIAITATSRYPIGVEGCGSACIGLNVYGDNYHPDELYRLGSVLNGGVV